MMNMINESKLFADGEDFIIFFQEGKNEVMYTFTKPLVSQIDVNFPHDFVPLLRTDNANLIIRPNPAEITIKLLCSEKNLKVESCEYGGLLKNMDLFRKVSVSQLFRVINSKIKKRGSNYTT